ncbi:uncharacterized protein LOC128663789 [Bombina bombina]|uniref:uncharacterized protein LOC128663789 n=1 Tax=Bombina bombina TaxID=8345 RepID=UPI00235A7B9D|nr:uncharacterized protein LOC128663789 [Bombina bombina]
MEVLKSLLLLWCFQEVIQCYGDNQYCADQVEAVRVKAGDTVTIPCRISFPKDWDENTTVEVYWREATSIPCGNARYIYKPIAKGTDEKYKGRLSIVGSQHKEASLRIQGLKTTDGPRFCCQVLLQNKEREERWQNRHTTVLQFQEHRHIYVEQLDAVPALQGENITIPCRIHNLPANKQELKEVIWRLGNSELCTDNKVSITERQQRNSNERYSVVDFPDDVSLHIKDVRPTDKKHYCCEVTVGFERVSSTHGTQLGVKDSKSDKEYFVHQPQKASATKGGSVTIPCSFNSTNNNDPLWVGIYWRVDSLTGPHAYHPSQEFINSTYMGRTQLMGQGDLHIQGLQEPDSTSYYCIVMLRFCIGTNKYNSVVAYGQGTSLIVTGHNNKIQYYHWKTYALIAARSVLFCIVILCGTLAVIKIKWQVDESIRKIEL